MPSAYAHYKFGKMVIPELPKDIKNVIKKYPAPFKAGLQGPDFLFYYRAFSKNKINQIGVSIHHKDFYSANISLPKYAHPFAACATGQSSPL